MSLVEDLLRMSVVGLFEFWSIGVWRMLLCLELRFRNYEFLVWEVGDDLYFFVVLCFFLGICWFCVCVD